CRHPISAELALQLFLKIVTTRERLLSRTPWISFRRSAAVLNSMCVPGREQRLCRPPAGAAVGTCKRGKAIGVRERASARNIGYGSQVDSPPLGPRARSVAARTRLYAPRTAGRLGHSGTADRAGCPGGFAPARFGQGEDRAPVNRAACGRARYLQTRRRHLSEQRPGAAGADRPSAGCRAL